MVTVPCGAPKNAVKKFTISTDISTDRLYCPETERWTRRPSGLCRTGSVSHTDTRFVQKAGCVRISCPCTLSKTPLLARSIHLDEIKGRRSNSRRPHNRYPSSLIPLRHSQSVLIIGSESCHLDTAQLCLTTKGSQNVSRSLFLGSVMPPVRRPFSETS